MFGTPTIVTGVSVAMGPAAGGTATTITGAGFTGATQVDFGTTPASDFVINSDTQITATVPPGTGLANVTVIKPGINSPVNSIAQFTYVAAPVVTGINTTEGAAAGGTTVTITGTGFTDATQVNFGTTSATYVVVNSTTQITATSPAGAVGTVDVTVATPGGTSAVVSADQFSYVAMPTVTTVSPALGSTAGGTSITITGTGFTNSTIVAFGTTVVTDLVIDSATQITVTSPAGTGTSDVTVINTGGTSSVSAVDQFTYVAGPLISGVSPASGPTAGGTSVTITGAGFTGATAVYFGTTPASNFVTNSDTEITASIPPGTNTVNVTVVTPAGTSPVFSADQFTYGNAPLVTGVSSSTGPLAGGTTVTITGTNLVAPGFLTLNDPAGVNGTYITGISGNTIVGYYIDASDLDHGFVYNGSSFTTLDDPAGVKGTYVAGISGNTIVGYYTDASDLNHGFVYNGSSFTTLDDPAGASTSGTFLTGVSGDTEIGYYYEKIRSGSVYLHVPVGFEYNGSSFTTLSDAGDGTVPSGISGSTIVGTYYPGRGARDSSITDHRSPTWMTLRATVQAARSLTGSVGALSSETSRIRAVISATGFRTTDRRSRP